VGSLPAVLSLQYALPLQYKSSTPLCPFCMVQTVKARLTEGRTEELMGLAKAVYRGRQHDNRPGSSQGDWASAERLLLQEQFTRGMGCTLSLVSTFKVGTFQWHQAPWQALARLALAFECLAATTTTAATGGAAGRLRCVQCFWQGTFVTHFTWMFKQ